MKSIAVIGATGHTGRFVVHELERRGLPVRLVGRDKTKLADLSRMHSSEFRMVDLEDPASPRAALEGAAAVINCAGPFLDTALPVIDAAIALGIHYLDVAPEQVAVQTIFEQRADIVRSAGITALPGAAFYGGLADLLASAVLLDGDAPEKINVRVGLDSWQPTLGTRLTGQRNVAPRVIQRGGALQVLSAPTPRDRWDFGGIGEREIAVVPLSEIITIASHIPAREITSWMNVEALRDISDSETPPPQPVDARGRSAQRFIMDVEVIQGGWRSLATARGQDIYYVTAPIVAEATERLVDGSAKRQPGVFALGSLFDARSFLSALGSDTLETSYSRENV